MAQTAGEQLRTRLDAGLKARGPGWEWTDFDAEVIASAVRHADRAEQLQAAYTAALAEGGGVASLTRLAAEVRHQERRVIELVAQVTAPAELPKSQRHQRASNARWNRKRDRDAAVVVPFEQNGTD